jgi:hypothetical protein
MDVAVMTITQITEKLNLKSLVQQWYITSTCAITGYGITEAFEWIRMHLAE